MTEELRRRFRYLAHLPLTTTFTLVELNLADDFLSESTLQHFAGKFCLFSNNALINNSFSADFAKREEARQRKAKEEKRQQTQAERWERAVMLDPSKFKFFGKAYQ